MELKSYVCPNCGANTTNAQNCDYCGSLLVRFVEKGIDLSHTSYLNNNEVFPGLIEELKRNLKLQEENLGIPVATDLHQQTATSGFNGTSIQSELMWADGTESPQFKPGTKKQLCITINFDTYTDISLCKEFHDEKNAQLAKFRQLDSFPLFTARICTYTDFMGESRYGREFAINFGEDAEGAARLVSEILIKVFGWSPSDSYEMFTNVGHDSIYSAREVLGEVTWMAAHSSDSNNSGCLGVIIAGLTVISASLALLF